MKVIAKEGEYLVLEITRKESLRFWIKIIIIFILMFGFGKLSPFSAMTPYGMQVLGVFLGMLFGWMFFDVGWTSLMGIVAVVITGITNYKAAVSIAFGNDAVITVLFLFIFTDVIRQKGITEYFADFIVSRKILIGRPWILSFALIVGAGLVSTISAAVLAMFVFWELIYKISDKVGYKPFQPWPTFMVLGISVASLYGSFILPFRPFNAIILDMYSSITGGTTINAGLFILYMLIMFSFTILGYMLMGRLLRVDVELLRNIDGDFVDGSKLKMNKEQKVTSLLIVLWLFFLLLPTFAPDFIISPTLASIGTSGITMASLAIMSLVHIDGKRMYDFQKTASASVQWPVILISAAIMLLIPSLTSADAGIQATLTKFISPLLNFKSYWIFFGVLGLITFLITNATSNITTMIIMATLTYPICVELGQSTGSWVMLILLTGQVAFLTPAATPAIAVMFANTKWVDPIGIYKFIIPTFIYHIFIFMTLGTFFATLIF